MHQMQPDRSQPSHDDIVAALISAPTKTSAAKTLGVHRVTLYRWLRDDAELREAYNASRHALLSDATESLQYVAEEAIGFLYALAADPDARAHVRATASAKILDSAYKAYELHELAKRVEQLERELA